VRTVAPEPSGADGAFWMGLAVAFVTMVVVAVGTLYVLGAFSQPAQSTLTGRVFTAEDLTPAPKPTAVWKFRAEWQKPEP
jgi:hypothetical protein